ncbi:MAG: ribonuclease D [Rickettsiaceae bacterium]|nr:ribonuclease D [Rickettsiaceae bacterium]
MKINFHEDDLPLNCDLKGSIAIDTETMGLNIARDKLCLVQLCDENEQVHMVRFKQNYDAPNLKTLLLDETRCKIFHFARFDIASIKHYLNISFNNIFCTKLASKIIRTYTEFHGLKELCRELLNVQISKQQQSSDWGSENLTIEQREYAARDVIYLHRLRDVLINMMQRENRLELFYKALAFLPGRVDFDLAGWHDIDIFAH